MRDVAKWLDQLGLGTYAAVFTENDIDAEVLPELTDQDLKELGISLGHRKKLRKAIAALREGSAPKDATPDPSVPPGPTPVTQTSEAERRQLTVMFCDLVGSTTLAEQLDPEDFRDVIRGYQDACAGVISRFGGYIAKYLGDGILVYFGFPRAHEDDAERAVRSALGIVDSIKTIDSHHGPALEIRIGIVTGLAVVGDIVGEGASQERAVVGETPNLAARLQGLADPNSVVISASTRDLLGEQFVYKDLGPQTLKGISERINVWRVTGEQAIESRFGATHAGRLTKFVGREQEVELLLGRWRQAKAGEGQVVLLSGEAGIGKSRITTTLRDRLRDEDHTRIQYQCSPHHVNSPLYPAIQQLVFAAGLAVNDAADRRLDKLEALLQQSSATREGCALIASLLSIPADSRYPRLNLSPQEQKQKTLDALTDLFAALAAQRPVLFVFEDAHWIDPTTREEMHLLVDRIAGLRGLAVITHRPEFAPPWTGYAHCTVLALNRLDRSGCTELIDSLTGGCGLPQAVSEQIVAKTDGVPLFVEELTKTVLESGFLTRKDDRYILTGSLGHLAIPSTLQDSLMARLDRLEEVKEISQIGAAIGREFSFTLLEAVSPLRGKDLEHALTRLSASEIVFRRGMPPNASYIFKHALIQDTAYETLLRSRRQQIHAQIAQALQTRFPERVDNEPEVLAHHFTRAGLAERAAPYWLQAGQRAVARSANHEAIAHLTKGLEALREFPAGGEASSLELDMQISLGSASIAVSGYSSAETEKACVRGRELLDTVGEDSRQFAVLHGLCMCYTNQAKFTLSLDVAEEMLNRSAQQSDPMSTLVSHRVVAVSHNVMGRFAVAREHAERAAALYDTGRDRDSGHQYGHDQGVAAYWHLSMALLFMGYRIASQAAANRASNLARELQHANTSAYDALYASFTNLVKNEFVIARDVAQVLINDALSRSMALWVVFGRYLLGSTLAALDEPEAGLVEIHRGRTEAEQLNHSWLKPMTLRFEAQALATLGHFDAAIACLDEALTVVEATEERWLEAEIHRVHGEINKHCDGSTHDSVASFQRVIEVARRQEAKLFELRAAASLGRLWYGQGKAEQAYDLIAPVYRWFTEGLDTPDLIETKALLDELSSRVSATSHEGRV